MKWINVKDGLPPTNSHGYGGEVYVVDEGYTVTATFQQGGFIRFVRSTHDPDEYDKREISPKLWQPKPREQPPPEPPNKE